jgi:hypothetical protein
LNAFQPSLSAQAQSAGGQEGGLAPLPGSQHLVHFVATLDESLLSASIRARTAPAKRSTSGVE